MKDPNKYFDKLMSPPQPGPTKLEELFANFPHDEAMRAIQNEKDKEQRWVDEGAQILMTTGRGHCFGVSVALCLAQPTWAELNWREVKMKQGIVGREGTTFRHGWIETKDEVITQVGDKIMKLPRKWYYENQPVNKVYVSKSTAGVKKWWKKKQKREGAGWIGPQQIYGDIDNPEDEWYGGHPS